MNKKLSFIFFLFVVLGCSESLPIEDYKAEILNLKTDKQKEAYWKELYHLDQDVLIGTESILAQDSISICNMIRTSLMFEIYGNEIYEQNNVVPILNFTHSSIGEAQLAFWPIILECYDKGGVIETVGGEFPAYQLESIALTFYGYSLLYQESKYQMLLDKLNNIKTKNTVSENLAIAFNNLKKRQVLKEIEVLGSWNNQPFKNLKEDGVFQFIMMSDGDLYLKRYGGIQKLIEIGNKMNSKLYRVEHEPFGWSFEYKTNGELNLLDDKNDILINYSEHK